MEATPAASVAVTVSKNETESGTTAAPVTVSAVQGSAAAVVGGSVDNQYFFEDEVFRLNKKGGIQFGIVLETCEAFSGDEDDEFDEILSKGEIRISWHPDGREYIEQEQMIGLVDRTLMPGDCVRRLLPGKDTQRGYCREINMSADVQIIDTKNVIKNVMAERLKPLASFSLGSAVCLDSWVGSTKNIDEKVILKSYCGAIIEVSSSDVFLFKDLRAELGRGIYHEIVFYPGQIITGRLDSMDCVKLLTPSIPLKTNKKGKPLARKFTVQSVRIDAVWVHWQCKALSEEGEINTNMLQQPDSCVTGEDLKRLKRLNLFESCMLQINDRNYLTFSDCDVVVKKSQWLKEKEIKYKLQLSQQQKEEMNQNLHGESNAMATDGSSTADSFTKPQHFEKIKKKLSVLDVEKSASLNSAKSGKMLQKALSKGSSIEKFKEKSYEADKSASASASASETSLNCTEKQNHPQKNNQLSNVDAVTTDEVPSVASTVDGWQTDEDDDDDFNGKLKVVESQATTISTCSSPTPRSSPKHMSRLQQQHNLNKKKIKKNKKSKTSSAFKLNNPEIGEQVIIEALLVYSTATVVWQDGTVEAGIASTQLYPIHHLDEHEFFPGDFVISSKEDSDVSFREYGVIQKVDHHGRTAHVRWFTTYTSADEPKPSYKGESEVSVYDLKDHPDFQYRPGTMVIRVANFVGEDSTCTSGQIIDNYTDGRVKVWWIDGHISMCWPQDLFEVGQYDHTDWGHESEDSWETESENSELGGDLPQLSSSESHILSNIEKARVAISRLEEMFNIDPNLQNHEVMRKLLAVYKSCRLLDRLTNTSFFHEDNFTGLLERVRKGGTQSISERAQDRKNRLFSETSPNTKQLHSIQAVVPVNGTQKITGVSSHSSPKEYAPRVVFNISPPFKYSASTAAVAKKKTSKSSATVSDAAVPAVAPSCLQNLLTITCAATNHSSTNSVSLRNNCESASPRAESSPKNQYNLEKNQLLSSVIKNIEMATEKTNQLKSISTTTTSSQDDSGNYSRNDNCDGSSTSYASSSDLTNIDAQSSLLKANNDDQQSVSCSSIELTDDSPELVCVRMCSLLREQLVKCINAIRVKYYKDDNLNLSEVIEYDIPAEADEDYLEGCDTLADLITSTKTPTIADMNLMSPTSVPISSESNAQSSSVTDEPKTDACTPIDLVQPVPLECFQVLSNAPKAHKFHLTICHPNNTQQYYRAVQREHRMLRSSVPPGVWVRVYEDRIDLVSVMIEGPKKTPYEDGMFLFDIQLGSDYPKSPPLCHYISYCSDRLNPNLYEDGKVCVSLLGTWSGRDSEVWGPNSTLLQVIVSIQGLILVAEPYYNEAGYEKQKGTQQASENSRMYNEMVIIKMVQATTKLLSSLPEIFRTEIEEHYKKNGLSMYRRIKGWMELSKLAPQTPADANCCMAVNTDADALDAQMPNKTNYVRDDDNAAATSIATTYNSPEFPLVPASRGFCLTLAGLLEIFNRKLEAINSIVHTTNDHVSK